VFDRTVEMTNYHQDFGDNVLIKCCPKSFPYDPYDQITVVLSFGTPAHPLIFTDQTFWRCVIDCNNLHARFVNCKFVECDFQNIGNVLIERSPFIKIHEFKAEHDHYVSDNRAYFTVPLDSDIHANGYVEMTPFTPATAILKRRTSSFMESAKSKATDLVVRSKSFRASFRR
jgi:hypothetical protein